MLIVDAHLDLAYSALRGRDLLKPAAAQAADDMGTPSVGLPDLRAGSVGLICATLFCEPSLRDPSEGYHTPEEARSMAMDQLGWYAQQTEAGQIRVVECGEDILLASAGPLSAILLMEGADPMRDAEDVGFWFDCGIRIVGLAWKQTRYAGGTGAPGPLTPEGVALVRGLDAVGMIHDVSHLAEESFWQLLDLSGGPVIASHSNCRSLIPTDRHLSDEMIRALVQRGAVIGVNFYEKFLLPPDQQGQRRSTLNDVIAQVRHVCELAGDTQHVGLGTDMDGGFGAEQIPQEIRSSADLPRVAEALAAAGFSDEATRQIMGENWARYFRAALPRGE